MPTEGLQQTQFAHIGTIRTPDGRFHVATQRLVLTGMLAPRGQRRMWLFDARANPVRCYSIMMAEPSWCEGSKVYLFGNGNVTGIPIDPRAVRLAGLGGMPTGNVVDFSQGLDKPVITREKRYGSSGGIDHDPWVQD